MILAMKLVDKNGHLNEEAIALFAEGLIDSKVYYTIPPELMDHVDSCFECKQKVMDVFEILRNDEDTLELIHVKNHKKKEPQNIRNIHKKRPFIKSLWMYAAASIILLVGFYIIIKSFQSSNNDRLFAKYFNPYQNLLTMKGETDDLVNKALSCYDRKIWDSAVYFFEQVDLKDKNIQAYQFYQANALLASGKSLDSEKIFLQVIESGDERFTTQARWYLALAMIKSGKKENAAEILRSLKSDKGIYGEKAIELLNQLE